MRCVIIAGSPDANPSFIHSTVKNDDFVICADKGYGYAVKAGINPDIIVGDFDSYKGEVSTDCKVIRLNPHKDDTDTLHCVNLGLEKGCDSFIILGALGGRLDHTYANLCTLLHILQHGAQGELLSEKESVRLLLKGSYCFENMQGKTFSLFPFGCFETNVSYTGAEYPLTGYNLKSNYPLGVSNLFSSEKSEIKINDGIAILIINLSEDYI